eukprot:351806-Chlamydomonas_euryale.AAC.8
MPHEVHGVHAWRHATGLYTPPCEEGCRYPCLPGAMPVAATGVSSPIDDLYSAVAMLNLCLWPIEHIGFWPSPTCTIPHHMDPIDTRCKGSLCGNVCSSLRMFWLRSMLQVHAIISHQASSSGLHVGTGGCAQWMMSCRYRDNQLACYLAQCVGLIPPLATRQKEHLCNWVLAYCKRQPVRNRQTVILNQRRSCGALSDRKRSAIRLYHPAHGPSCVGAAAGCVSRRHSHRGTACPPEVLEVPNWLDYRARGHLIFRADFASVGHLTRVQDGAATI